jgi:hypothetical protein
MISRFLLHDPSDMGIGGVSGKRKLRGWGGVLEGHHCCQEAFCTLECLLCRSGPLQRFDPFLQEISQRAQHLCAIGQKMAVEIHHAEKTLQLFDVLRWWAEFDFSGVVGRGGAAPAAEIMWPKISKEGAAKTHFSRFMARPLVIRAVKKASRWWRCVCMSGEPTRESSMYANTSSRPFVVRSIIL